MVEYSGENRMHVISVKLFLDAIASSEPALLVGWSVGWWSFLALLIFFTILPTGRHLRVIKSVCLWTFKSNCGQG